MNTLIETGYVIENAKDLLSDDDFKLLNKISTELCNSNKEHLKFYQFEYCLNKDDVEYFDLRGHKASVKFSDRIDVFGGDSDKMFSVDMKKKIVKKYFDSVQTYGETFYKDDTFRTLSNKIANAVADKYYPHIFKLEESRKQQIHYVTTRIATYDNECHITKHRDGFSNKRLFVLLIYLNDEWEESNGGELVIYDKKNEKISHTPKAPSVCILDFTKNNLEHEVLKVISGTRYTYVAFYEVSDSLMSTDEWKEHKIKKIM